MAKPVDTSMEEEEEDDDDDDEGEEDGEDAEMDEEDVSTLFERNASDASSFYELLIAC
jgi:hypothetical protein